MGKSTETKKRAKPAIKDMVAPASETFRSTVMQLKHQSANAHNIANVFHTADSLITELQVINNAAVSSLESATNIIQDLEIALSRSEE